MGVAGDASVSAREVSDSIARWSDEGWAAPRAEGGVFVFWSGASTVGLVDAPDDDRGALDAVAAGPSVDGDRWRPR
jgi:hypothetical protein